MAIHIEEIDIRGFRGIKSLNLDNLSDINIIVGDNNTGKTSVLEAIQLFCEPTVYGLTKLARQRDRYRASFRTSLSIIDSVCYLFNVDTSCDSNYEMALSGQFRGQIIAPTITAVLVNQIVDINELSKRNPAIRARIKESISIDDEIPTLIGDISFNNTNCYQIDGIMDNIDATHFEINDYLRNMVSGRDKRFINYSNLQVVDQVLQNSFSNLIRNKSVKDTAIELLKEFDSSITDIRYINEDDRFIPIIENTRGNYVPLSLYGDGMKKAMTILNAIVSTNNGVVLIDEFETAIHTSAMIKVFKFMLDAAKKMNVQLFLTTHSLEALDKMLVCSDEFTEKINIIRLKENHGKLYAKITPGHLALENRQEYKMELRV